MFQGDLRNTSLKISLKFCGFEKIPQKETKKKCFKLNFDGCRMNKKMQLKKYTPSPAQRLVGG